MKNSLLISTGFLCLCCSVFAGGTVNNLTQAGLEAALAGGGAVLFGTNGTLTLTNTILIAKGTTLDGNGNKVVVSGGNSIRLFEVASNVTFAINGLTLADGRVVAQTGDAFGAGIWNQGGQVVLTGCALTNNSVQGANDGNGGSGFGSAICAIGGSLNITNCSITSNHAVGGIVPYGQALGQAMGGAIYSQGTEPRLQGVVLSNNTVTGGAPSQSFPGTSSWGPAGNGFGGALYVTNSAVMMSFCVVQSNTAYGGALPPQSSFPAGPGSGDGDGGGLFVCQDCICAISDSTFLNNSAIGGLGDRNYGGGSGHGGDVFNNGDLQIRESTFSNSQTTGGDSLVPGVAQGGAIYSTGVLSINGCAFLDGFASAGNGTHETDYMWPGVAAEGGALWSSGTLACTNSTITACQVLGGSGGGGEALGPGGPGTGGGVYLTNATATLVNLTLAANRPDGSYINYQRNAGPALGGNLAVSNATVTVLNSIIANSGNGGDVWGSVTDGGYNICSDGSAGFSEVGSLNNTDPKLGPLGDYGGPTQTLPLLAGSPAIDGGGLVGAPSTDQRGRTRPFGPAIDIGAFESSPPYILAGRVRGFTLEDEVSVSTSASTTTTTNHGLFRLDGFASGTYTLSATHSNYVFTPSSQNVTLGPDQLDLAFHAFRWHDLSPEPITNGLNHLVLAAAPGTTWRILASTNTQDWIVVSTNSVGLNSTLDSFLPSAPGQTQLYRAVSP